MSTDVTNLSPSETTNAFRTPLPLIRVPIAAGRNGDGGLGNHVLAFRDQSSWELVWKNEEEKLIEQCIAGAQMGCSVRATQVCSPPWWQWWQRLSSRNKAGRDGCEVKAMENCLESANDTCERMANETCQAAFEEMRIARSPTLIHPRFLSKLPLPASYLSKRQFRKISQEIQDASEFNETYSRVQRQHMDPFVKVRDSDSTVYTIKGPRTKENSEHVLKSSTSTLETIQDQYQPEGYEGGLIHPKRENCHKSLAIDPINENLKSQRK